MAAFIELAQKQGWFEPRYTQSSYTHRDAMRALVFSGVGQNPEVGIHLEGTYWYNECESYDTADKMKEAYQADPTIFDGFVGNEYWTIDTENGTVTFNQKS